MRYDRDDPARGCVAELLDDQPPEHGDGHRRDRERSDHAVLAGLVTIDATISFNGGDATAVLDGSAANDQPGGGLGSFTGGVLSANDGPSVVGGGRVRDRSAT